MLRQAAAEMTIAELILATGSNAGVAASIHEGFYMIGRHQECQIRPKSKSVSRRHCLVHHVSGVVRVLDLKSTTGTMVNATRLEPQRWRTLKEGDEIRCGKVVFQLSLAGSGETGRSAPKESMETGEAWHDFDVAGFLDAEDDADREERYRNIRSKDQRTSQTKEQENTSDTDTDIDALDTLAETFSEEDDSSTDTSVESALPVKKSKDDKPTSKPGPNKQSRQVRMPKAKGPRKARTRRNLSWQLGGAGQLKAIGIVLFTIVAVGSCAYQIYQFSNPSSTRVVEELDY